jgi:UDP-N-acetylglucosamine 2-epimerase (non-hydrolysing)/GDP/UDP-N,N'-diacetylbacillosamine 2-epimerase (hydrolysing)
MNAKKTPRKICVFSGKRGGFGAYVPLLRLMEKDPALEPEIILGDMHASEEFGATADEAGLLFPGIPVHVISMGTGRGDTAAIRAENIGACMTEAGRLLADIRPDIVMVHGDRGEHLAVALAALTLNITVAHTQGGDISGNIDDIIRHGITKLAHLHFPETREAARRIARMGEEASRIHTVGSLYIDRIVKKIYPDPDKTRKKYSVAPGERLGIFVYHPETGRTGEENGRAARTILSAAAESGLGIIAVYPCSDPGYRGIISALHETGSRYPAVRVHKNIPHLDFLSLMSSADVLLGNSSAAIKEGPYLRIPALNFGSRQEGRPREASVIDCRAATADIRKKINFVSRDASFRKKLARCGTHLGDGRASERILAVLKKISLDKGFFNKKMTY